MYYYCQAVEDGAADVPAPVQQLTSDTQTTVTVTCAPIVPAKTSSVTLGLYLCKSILLATEIICMV